MRGELTTGRKPSSSAQPCSLACRAHTNGLLSPMQKGQTSVAGTSQTAQFHTGGSLRAKSLVADRPMAPVRVLKTRRVSSVVEPKSYSYDRRCPGTVRICE